MPLRSTGAHPAVASDVGLREPGPSRRASESTWHYVPNRQISKNRAKPDKNTRLSLRKQRFGNHKVTNLLVLHIFLLDLAIRAPSALLHTKGYTRCASRLWQRTRRPKSRQRMHKVLRIGTGILVPIYRDLSGVVRQDCRTYHSFHPAELNSFPQGVVVDKTIYSEVKYQ